MHKKNKSALMPIISAVGVIFGDIGTSPIYALKESLQHTIGMPTDLVIYGLLSLLFWTLVIIVCFKYVIVMLSVDNNGEGGLFALLGLSIKMLSEHSKKSVLVFILTCVGVSLFFSDATLTPAISVLSAVEGIAIKIPSLEGYIVIIAIVILTGVFLLQNYGTAKVGKVFGPVMLIWFITLAIIGIFNIFKYPHVIIEMLNPYNIIILFRNDFSLSFFALGSIVLVFTGVEAIYADMGHFGHSAVRKAWFIVVFPALVLNYMGQGAAVLSNPDVAENPFYMSVPDWSLIPLVILATFATIIASQAVISGMFSLVNQAIQLRLFPRLRVEHTSRYEAGQIYIPFVNYMLFVLVIFVVLMFKDSSSLASAYGFAVVGTMICTTVVSSVVLYKRSKNNWYKAGVVAVFLLFFLVDIVYFSSNLTKIKTGGWFPIAVSVMILLFFRVWIRGIKYYKDTITEQNVPLRNFLHYVNTKNIYRIEGTAVYMTQNGTVTPRPLIQNLKHNKVLHNKVFFLTIKTILVPFTDKKDFIKLKPIMPSFYRIEAYYGFKETPNVVKILMECKERFGVSFDIEDTSFFISHDTLKIVNADVNHTIIGRKLFVWINNNAAKASDFFNIPSGRVIEIGTNVDI